MGRPSRSLRRGFTLIELLVVVAIIALLISILLPALTSAREQGKKAKCLAHLKGIGTALYSYASDDPKEQVIPISRNMVTPQVPYWLHRTADWFGYGGNSATRPFPTGGTKYMLGGDPNYYTSPGGTLVKGYSAQYRPLNMYMGWQTDTVDNRSLKQFECPGDKGYPDDKTGNMDDAPLKSVEISCYEMLGNSFRASLAHYRLPSNEGLVDSLGFFAFGPWGHRMSTLTETSRTILLGEPTFFNMIHSDNPNGSAVSIPYIGWHKGVLKDNLLFIDGSARYTSVPKPEDSDKYLPGDVAALNITSKGLLRRGPSYKLDVYPTPGARLWGDWRGMTGTATTWPWRGFQDNLGIPTSNPNTSWSPDLY